MKKMIFCVILLLGILIIPIKGAVKDCKANVILEKTWVRFILSESTIPPDTHKRINGTYITQHLRYSDREYVVNSEIKIGQINKTLDANDDYISKSATMHYFLDYKYQGKIVKYY